MPRLAINYENACIYEIVCKDVNVTQRYVGSTTNLIKRRFAHKSNCNNEKGKPYSFYVYQFIRENGSFENWDVVLIEQVIDCKDKEHLHKRERFFIEEKKAELNKYIPLRTIKEFLEENKEVLAERNKEYRQENKQKMKEYRKSNKYKIAEQQRIYYEENKVVLAERMKEYQQININKITEYNRAYRKNNKEKILEYQRAYRAK
jgi:hypothetical protein